MIETNGTHEMISMRRPCYPR